MMLRRILNLMVAAIILLMASFGLVLLWMSYNNASRTIYQDREPVEGSPEDYGATVWRDVSFESADGTPISAWYIPPAADKGPALLMLHGLGINRSIFENEAPDLIAAGYGLLMIDFRGSGRSGGDRASLGYHETEDAVAAYRLLEQQPEVDPERLGIYGMSMGAATALRTMARVPEAKAVVADAPFISVQEVVGDGVTQRTGLPPHSVSWAVVSMMNIMADGDLYTVRPIDDVQTFGERATLFLHGELDELVPIRHSEALYAATSGTKAFQRFPRAEHADIYVTDPDGWREAVLPFLAEHLGGEAQVAAR